MHEKHWKVKIQYYSDLSDDFTYQLKPYNLKDLLSEKISSFDFKYDTNFSEIELEKWGTVNFVSVVRRGNKRNTLFLYLVDDSKNILYDFSEPVGFPNDFTVKEFLFTDINKDNKKDLLLVLTGLSDHNLYDARVYTANEIGGFEMDTDLRNKLNNSKKPFNKNINNILTYLNKNYKTVGFGSWKNNKLCNRTAAVEERDSEFMGNGIKLLRMVKKQ